TAMNIQHLESLADVVSRITGVVVRETVPDRVLQEATDVVLVDITPDELIERLHACVGADEVSERVVRRAAQLATSLNADWTVVYIERIGQEGDARKAAQVAKTFSLAERLGGDTTRLQGIDFPAEILRLARRE